MRGTHFVFAFLRHGSARVVVQEQDTAFLLLSLHFASVSLTSPVGRMALPGRGEPKQSQRLTQQTLLLHMTHHKQRSCTVCQPTTGLPCQQHPTAAASLTWSHLSSTCVAPTHTPIAARNVKAMRPPMSSTSACSTTATEISVFPIAFAVLLWCGRRLGPEAMLCFCPLTCRNEHSITEVAVTDKKSALQPQHPQNTLGAPPPLAGPDKVFRLHQQHPCCTTHLVDECPQHANLVCHFAATHGNSQGPAGTQSKDMANIHAYARSSHLRRESCWNKCHHL